MQNKERILVGALGSSYDTQKRIAGSEICWPYSYMSDFEIFDHSFILIAYDRQELR